MKHLTSLILITLLLAACGKNCERHLFLITENGKSGYIDSTGKVIIEPVFLAAGNFSEGLAPARLNSDYGFIDQRGKFVIAEQYEYATPFSEGLAKVYLDGKPFFIDHRGKKAFDSDFAEMKPFVNGRSEVITASSKKGIIDKRGKLILDTAYTNIGAFNRGYAVVTSTETKDGKVLKESAGVVDSLGKVMIPFGRYDRISDLSSGVFMVWPKKQHKAENARTEFIDILGRKILSDEEILPERLFRIIGTQAGNGMIQIELWSQKHQRYHEAFIDLHGKLAIDNPKIVRYNPIKGRNMIAENVHGKRALTDAKGKLLTKFIFDDLYREEGKYFVVRQNGKYGIIDSEGSLTLKPEMVSLSQVVGMEGYFYFRDSSSDKEGIIDYKGKVILKPVIGRYVEFENGLMKTDIDKKTVYINRNGKIVWKQKSSKPVVLQDLNIDYSNKTGFYGQPKRDPYRRQFRSSDFGILPAPIPAGLPFQKGKLDILVRKEEKATFAGRYNGYTVYIVNDQASPVDFERIKNSGSLMVTLQAKDRTGKWRDVEEGFTPSLGCCVMTYRPIKLDPKMSWKFVVPEYGGNFQTQLRFKMVSIAKPLKEDQLGYVGAEIERKTTYSQSFEGSINPAQFWRNDNYYWQMGDHPGDMPGILHYPDRGMILCY